MQLEWINLNNQFLNINELTPEEYEQYYDNRVQTFEIWSTNTYLGPLTNNEGRIYCECYNEELDQIERSILKHGIDGTMQRDVWNQIMFCTPYEYEQLIQSKQ